MVLIGYSGHGYVVAEAALLAGYDIRYYCDRNAVDRDPYALTYIGSEISADFDGWGKNYLFTIGIGNNQVRKQVGELVLDKNEQLETVVHPASGISVTASVGDGVFVSRGVIVNAQATIGNYVILNTGCIIEHECSIGEAAHIAPGAVLAGNVRVGERSFVGANAVVKQGVQIGKDVIIGAGAVVITDIPDGTAFAGNPAKQINDSK